jgi:hypothetical protein
MLEHLQSSTLDVWVGGGEKAAYTSQVEVATFHALHQGMQAGCKFI